MGAWQFPYAETGHRFIAKEAAVFKDLDGYLGALGDFVYTDYMKYYLCHPKGGMTIRH
jgi:hypothetical protein